MKCGQRRAISTVWTMRGNQGPDGSPADASSLINPAYEQPLRRRARQRDGGGDGSAPAGPRSDVQAAPDQLGPLGHRQQTVAAHLVGTEWMLKSVETDSVVDDFQPSGVGVNPERQPGRRGLGVLDHVL